MYYMHRHLIINHFYVSTCTVKFGAQVPHPTPCTHIHSKSGGGGVAYPGALIRDRWPVEWHHTLDWKRETSDDCCRRWSFVLKFWLEVLSSGWSCKVLSPFDRRRSTQEWRWRNFTCDHQAFFLWFSLHWHWKTFSTAKKAASHLFVTQVVTYCLLVMISTFLFVCKHLVPILVGRLEFRNARELVLQLLPWSVGMKIIITVLVMLLCMSIFRASCSYKRKEIHDIVHCAL